MGLSLCYEFRAHASAEKARQLVHELHAIAVTLPFQEVMDVLEYPGQRLHGMDEDESDLQWLKVFGTQYGRRRQADGAEAWIEIPPKHALGFGVQVADGAETAYFGLATHQAVVEYVCDGTTEFIETGLAGVYSWAQCCKTQYAGLQQFGGDENFLRAHRALVELLDHARHLPLEVQVHDDSGYFLNRDEARLVEQLRKWNSLVAALAGQMKDRLGRGENGVQAPIFSAPDFEHLEAEGLAQWPEPPKDPE